jgi:Amt family ammonium transporter
MNLILCFLAIFLMPFAAAGLGLIQAGLGRSRSAAHALLTTLCALAVTSLVFVLVGFSWAGYAGGAAHNFTLSGVAWNWLGAEQLLARGVHFDGGTSATNSIAVGLVLCFELFAVAIAAIIPIGAGTDRWRLSAFLASTTVFGALTWPLFAHWAWGGGWLSRVGTVFSLGAGFVDAGGSGVIHTVGGLTALSLAWILGARKGKYAGDGTATAIPGHNIVMVLAGCILALVGWMGVNAGGSLLFYGAGAARMPGIIVNTLLAASAAALAALATTRLRFGKPDASLVANGWVAGLVAGSAGCAFVAPAAAAGTGLIAGVLVVFSVDLFEQRLLIDDPGGAISVHAVGGVWGVLAAGLFVGTPAGMRGAQVLAQLVGIAALLGFMLPLTYGVNWLLNRVVPQRVDRDGDWHGMDIRELGAGAYPEFVMHNDEFVPR